MNNWRDRILAIGAIVVITFVGLHALLGDAFGWTEMFAVIIIAIFFAVPIVVLYIVALSRGRSASWAWLGLLGMIGLLIGLIALLTMPQPEKPRPNRF